jgi:hypothetical protein
MNSEEPNKMSDGDVVSPHQVTSPTPQEDTEEMIKEIEDHEKELAEEQRKLEEAAAELETEYQGVAVRETAPIEEIMDTSALTTLIDQLEKNSAGGENLELFGAAWQNNVSREMTQKQMVLTVDESQPVPEPVKEIIVAETVSQVESAPPPMTQEERDADHQDLLAFADLWAAQTVKAGLVQSEQQREVVQTSEGSPEPQVVRSPSGVKALRQHFEEVARPPSPPTVARKSSTSSGEAVPDPSSPPGKGKITVNVAAKSGTEKMNRGQQLFKEAEERMKAQIETSGETPKASVNVVPIGSFEEKQLPQRSPKSPPATTRVITVSSRTSTERQSSGETKPMSERDRRAQEARARVAARVRNRHSSSPSPPQQVAVAPLAAELIANAPPAVQAPESGVSETGARAEWRQQKAESLEQQNDKAMDVIQRVKAMSASMPVGEEEKPKKPGTKTSEIKFVLSPTKSHPSDQPDGTTRKPLTVTVQSVARDTKTVGQSSSEERTGTALSASDSSEALGSEGESPSQSESVQSREHGRHKKGKRP